MIITSEFPSCCGLSITYGFGKTGVLDQAAKNSIEKITPNGANILALAHYQWNLTTLEFLQEQGYRPILTDFFNKNSNNRITLFAKLGVSEAHKAAVPKGKSSAWEKVKSIFGK